MLMMETLNDNQKLVLEIFIQLLQINDMNL